MKVPAEFKIITATLLALLVTMLLQRFVYSAFVMMKLNRIVWYDIGIWKQYWTWLPGKILCIVNLTLIVLLIAEFLRFVWKGWKK